MATNGHTPDTASIRSNYIAAERARDETRGRFRDGDEEVYGQEFDRWFAQVHSAPTDEPAATGEVPTSVRRQLSVEIEERGNLIRNEETTPSGHAYVAGVQEGWEHAAKFLRGEYA